MLKLVCAVESNRGRWDHILNYVGITDPHFALDYYKAFGGGALAVWYDGVVPVIAKPFRYQGKQWIGNAYNYGGAIGSSHYANAFFKAFEDWKAVLELNERCTELPYDSTVRPEVSAVSRPIVSIPLRSPLQLRQTARHCIEKSARLGITTDRVLHTNIDEVNNFWKAYTYTMQQRNAEPHWFYPQGFFSRVLEFMGPQRSALFRTGNGSDTYSYCLLLFDKRNCYYHWAARLPDSPISDHYQVSEIIRWAANDGELHNLCLGGGHESLLNFKKSFSDTTIDCISYECLSEGVTNGKKD